MVSQPRILCGSNQPWFAVIQPGIIYAQSMSYVALGLFAFAVLMAFGNLAGGIAALIRKRRGGDRGFSSIPLVSLVLCTLAWAIGGQALGWWVFIPAILDPGTWMLAALPFVLLEEFKPSAPSAASPRTAGARAKQQLDTTVALRLLGPMASLAVQRRFVIGGTTESYGLPCEFLENAHAFVERARATPTGMLATVRELARLLEETGPHIPVSDASVSNERLIENDRGWDTVRRAAESVLREMGAAFDEWERSELERPLS